MNTNTTPIEQRANALADTPMEQWHKAGLPIQACSANADGIVNSFICKVRGRRYYGHRKHEFVNGAFTGRSWFVVESMTH
jgi:hypothetical protein